ncbi:MAG: hypothetical protein MUC96_21435 [Myxococcaceae bacterium]|nr:hypothetical protein [Myxococcaceae bacterium]
MARALTTQALLVAARAAWPELTFDEAAFVEFLAQRRGAVPVHAGDLLLVFLWSVGDERAQRHLESQYLSQLPFIISAVDRTPEFIADVVQEVKAKLYAERRLLQYAGRGPLGGWLRRAALNTASVLKRPERRQAPADPSTDELVVDPELAFFKQRYGPHFRQAFVDALAALTPRERTVLRLNSLSNVSIDELGAMYSVHRATAARWVQRAREQVVERTRDLLVERLSLEPAEVGELLAMMRSQLDVSLRQFA